MEVVVVGSGMAGLTTARRLVDAGHRVVVVDKGRRPGGRMATADLGGGALADHGAQFWTVRSPELAAERDRWLAGGTVREWCRGFGTEDGHPRYAVPGGMAGDLERAPAVEPHAGRFGVNAVPVRMGPNDYNCGSRPCPGFAATLEPI